MRNLKLLDQYRKKHPMFPDMGDSGNGYFEVLGTGSTLRIVASTGDGWDHVSISTVRRCPKWPKMKKIKEMFFLDEYPEHEKPRR